MKTNLFHKADFDTSSGLCNQITGETSEEKTEACSASFAITVLDIEKRLSAALNQIPLSPPVEYSYNPLDYAWDTHSCLVTKYCNSRKRILFVGMNPGPWGMVQTGIPFGEVRIVQDWLGIIGNIGKPDKEHPKRKVQGFQCCRSEISGQRFWGFFRDLCLLPENFFKNCFVYSYCPLSFMHSSARNITPPELKSCDRQALTKLCDTALAEIMTALGVEIAIGIGKFAEYRIRETVKQMGPSHITVGCILHPSPISPAANKGWKESVTKSLMDMNILHIVRGDTD